MQGLRKSRAASMSFLKLDRGTTLDTCASLVAQQETHHISGTLRSRLNLFPASPFPHEHDLPGRCRDTTSPNSKLDLIPGVEPCRVEVAVESPRPHRSLFSCTHTVMWANTGPSEGPHHTGVHPGLAQAGRGSQNPCAVAESSQSRFTLDSATGQL